MAPFSTTPQALLLLLLCSQFLPSTIAFCPTRQHFAVTLRSAAHIVPSTRQTPVRVVSELRETGVDAPEEDLEQETYQTNLKLAQLASQCASRGRQSRLLAISAYDMLKSMRNPDTVGYNSVLKAFAKCSPSKLPAAPREDGSTGPWVLAAERAQDLLEEMMELYDQQSAAIQEWYVRISQGTLTDEELERGPPRIPVKPNVRSFSTVMDAWSRMGNVAATLRVLAMLEARYEESNYNAALQPNIFSYNTVLAAYAKSKIGAEQAEDFLHSIPHRRSAHKQHPVEPDVISYNAVMHAWAQSGAPNAGPRAEAILRSMPVEPNSRSYTTAIDAWSRTPPSSDEPNPEARAHELFQELKQLYEESGDEKLKPNCVSYGTVINAYAYSKDPRKAQKAYAILQEMIAKGQKDPHVRPNTVVYNSVLNACATSSFLSTAKSRQGEMSLPKIVQTLYHDLVSDEYDYLKPDHFTFGTVLKACANNIFLDDPAFGMHVFEEACRRGQVSKGVLVQLKQAVPSHFFQDFFPRGAYDRRSAQFSMSNIPDSWKRNVRERYNSR